MQIRARLTGLGEDEVGVEGCRERRGVVSMRTGCRPRAGRVTAAVGSAGVYRR